MSHVDKEIYLFDELLPEEQARVRAHLARCPVCEELFKQRQEERVEIKKALMPEVPYHRARVTGNIMTEVRRHQTQSRSGFLGQLFAQPIRTGFAIVSAFLTLAFVVEYGRQLPEPTTNHSVPGGASLNSALLVKRERKTGTKISLLSRCVYTCDHLSAKDCQACRSRIIKLNN